jgi:hypothetical protein
MEEKNFSLLTQTEIDALIHFLNDKGTAPVESGVLTQDSIDKIIRVLTSEVGGQMDVKTGLGKLEAIVDNAEIKDLELKFELESDSDNALLYVVRGDENVYISPSSLELKKIVKSEVSWGRAIEPTHFSMLARAFELNFTEETYERVVKRFAKVMYGDENAKVAQIYLPDAVSVASSLAK